MVCPVHGWAAGIGLQLALAADFAVVAAAARLWEPYSERGFTPDSGATWLLPRLVGVVRARELLLLGQPVSGAEAAEWGIVHRAVPGDASTRRRAPSSPSWPRRRRWPSGSPSGCCTPARPRLARAPAERGLRHGAVVAQRGLPRGARGLPREAAAGIQGPMTRARAPFPPHTLAVGARSRRPRSWRQCGTGCAPAARGVAPGRLGGGGQSARSAPEPTTRRGTRCSARSGLVAPTWPGVRRARSSPATARPTEAELAPFNLGGSTRWGSTWPRRRSSPTAPRSSDGVSCRPSCATRRSGASCSASPAPAPTWRRWPPGPSATATSGWSRGQKVWTTWAHLADFGVLLARTDPDVPKRRGITYFLSTSTSPGSRCGRCANHRGDRLQRGVPRRGAGPRRPAGRRRRRRVDRWPTPPCRANGRWCRARDRAGWTASAARARSSLVRLAAAQRGGRTPGGCNDPVAGTR